MGTTFSITEKQRGEIVWRSWATFTTLCILVAQIFVVYYSKSMAVTVDTVHVGSDLLILIGGLGVAILSLTLTHEASLRVRKIFTFVGICLLVGGAMYSLFEIHLRIKNPIIINEPWVVFLTGLIGGAGNKFVHSLLGKIPKEHQGHDHKVMSLHVLFDMILSAIVCLSIAINYLVGWDQSDSAFGFLAAIFIIFLAGRLSSELWPDGCPSNTQSKGLEQNLSDHANQNTPEHQHGEKCGHHH